MAYFFGPSCITTYRIIIIGLSVRFVTSEMELRVSPFDIVTAGIKFCKISVVLLHSFYRKPKFVAAQLGTREMGHYRSASDGGAIWRLKVAYGTYFIGRGDYA